MNTLYQPIRSTCSDGTAEVAFAFDDPAVNPLDLTRLAQIVAACETAGADPHVEVVVLRSGSPLGFSCGVTRPTRLALQNEADRLAFTVAGQRLIRRLKGVSAVTVAVVEGVCLGVGLELALACDLRLAVARPDSWVGGDPAHPPAWGGSLHGISTSAEPITAREALARGWFHDVYSARRARMETQTHIDKLLARPQKPQSRERLWGMTAEERLAAERRAFTTHTPGLTEEVAPVSLPGRVGVWGLTPYSAQLAAELTLRNVPVTVVPVSGDLTLLDEAWQVAFDRGRVTPLELDAVRKRLTVTGDVRALLPLSWVIPGDADFARTLPVPTRLSRDTIGQYARVLGADPTPLIAEAPRAETPALAAA